MTIAKTKPIRSNKIRQSARDEECTVMFFGCQGAETTVLAHLPCTDKGMGIKSPDWWSVYACQNCHDILDGRNEKAREQYKLAGMYERIVLAAVYKTMRRMIEKGLIKIG